MLEFLLAGFYCFNDLKRLASYFLLGGIKLIAIYFTTHSY